MAINTLKSLPPIGRAFFSKWLEKINEIINGVNSADGQLDPEVEGSLANTVAGMEDQFDPEVEGSLANTVADIEEQFDTTTEGTLAYTVDGVVDEIGDDETANTILGRITALESGGEWETIAAADIFVEVTGAHSGTQVVANDTAKITNITGYFKSTANPYQDGYVICDFKEGDYQPFSIATVSYFGNGVIQYKSGSTIVAVSPCLIRLYSATLEGIARMRAELYLPYTGTFDSVEITYNIQYPY